MQMLVEKFGDVAVVAVHEDTLDASNADDFRREMEPVLAESHKLVLNSAGSRSWTAAAARDPVVSQERHRGRRRLEAVPRHAPARTVFDLIRLHRICEIVETKEQAVAAFSKK